MKLSAVRPSDRATVRSTVLAFVRSSVRAFVRPSVWPSDLYNIFGLEDPGSVYYSRSWTFRQCILFSERTTLEVYTIFGSRSVGRIHITRLGHLQQVARHARRAAGHDGHATRVGSLDHALDRTLVQAFGRSFDRSTTHSITRSMSVSTSYSFGSECVQAVLIVDTLFF